MRKLCRNYPLANYTLVSPLNCTETPNLLEFPGLWVPICGGLGGHEVAFESKLLPAVLLFLRIYFPQITVTVTVLKFG